jgi:formylglycine-generating enzyme required for sulfatase activity
MARFRAAVALSAAVPWTECVLAQEPGQTFKDCPKCPEMVVVPAGSFTMG